MPRFDDARLDREIATLRYVGRHTSIPVAKVRAFDYTSENPLKSPFVIQNRITGHDLQHAPAFYPDLTYKQKCEFATQFGKILLALQATSNPFPGRIEFFSDDDDTQKFTIHPFEVAMNPLATDSGLDDALDVPTYKTTLDFFLSQFFRWKAAALRDNNNLKTKYMERLTDAVCQMNQCGFLSDDRICLCHLDLALAPRNIMADIQPDGRLTISGILD